MNKIIFICCFVIVSFIGNAQTYQWAKGISGINSMNPSFEVNVNDMIASTDGNSYIAGKFTGTVDFDPSNSAVNRTALGTDGFIARYKSDGSLDWVKTTNLTGDEEYAALSFFNNQTNSIYYMTSVLKIGNNAFKIETLNRIDGSVINSSSVFTSTGTIEIKEMNKSGYMVGGFTGTLVLGNNNLVSNGLSDGFCLRLNANTTSYDINVAKSYGGTGNDIVNCIYDKYMGGTFTGTIDIAGNRTSAGGKDGFFFKFNTSTLFPESALTSKTIGGTGDDEVLSIIDSFIQGSGNNNVAIGGYFTGTVDFNVMAATTNLVSTGGKDGFTAAYEFNVDNNTYIGNGYNKFGTAYDDEISSLSITDATSKIYFCGKYGNASGGSEAIIGSRDRTSPGAINTSYSGTFKPTSTSGKINPKSVQFLGGNIFYAGDFTEETDFNITAATTNNLSVNTGGTNAFLQRTTFCNQSGVNTSILGDGFLCLGESTTLKIGGVINGNLRWDWFTGGCSNTYIGSGTEITVTPNTVGPIGYFVAAEGGCVPKGNCVSTFVQVSTVSNTITVNGNTLTAVANGNNISYQWLNCNSGNAVIQGATNQSYTPSLAGSYAVQITNSSGCRVTSDCQQMTLNIDDLNRADFTILPNPTSGYFSISANTAISTVLIFNIVGQKTIEFNEPQETYDISALSAGNYIVKIQTNSGVITKKLVKEF